MIFSIGFSIQNFRKKLKFSKKWEKKIDQQKTKNLLKKGKVIIFPTETVFGIGADATNAKAINVIYSIKKRPKTNPLICHFKNLREVKKHFKMNINFQGVDDAQKIIDRVGW